MILGIILLLIFLFFALLMYLNKLPALIALPIMAVVISLVAGVPYYFNASLLSNQELMNTISGGDQAVAGQIAFALSATRGNLGASFMEAGKDVLSRVLSEGAVRLNMAIAVILFGAMLGQFINKSGIAETLIKKAAELAGDKPFVVSLMLTAVVALLFTVLGGLGAVIMVATIVLPIMLSIGMPPMLAGCLFLLGLSLGGVFNLANWQLYISVLKLDVNTIMAFALPFGLAMVLLVIGFLAIELKRGGRVYNWATIIEKDRPQGVSWPALLTPIVPLALVFGVSLYNFITRPKVPFEFPIIAAMIIGLVYGAITIGFRKRGMLNLIAKSIFEGIANVAPAVALIMGIGMILNAVMHPSVSSVVSPLLSRIMPHTAAAYVVFFVALAPLALYRGPLNIWGMGSGLIVLMLQTKALPAIAIAAALMSVGQIQGVCDPTNTHNVWVANFLNVNVQDILKKTILYMWLLALIGLLIAGVRYF